VQKYGVFVQVPGYKRHGEYELFFKLFYFYFNFQKGMCLGSMGVASALLRFDCLAKYHNLYAQPCFVQAGF
jgi:hypothetical protein